MVGRWFAFLVILLLFCSSFCKPNKSKTGMCNGNSPNCLTTTSPPPTTITTTTTSATTTTTTTTSAKTTTTAPATPISQHTTSMKTPTTSSILLSSTAFLTPLISTTENGSVEAQSQNKLKSSSTDSTIIAVVIVLILCVTAAFVIFILYRKKYIRLPAIFVKAKNTFSEKNGRDSVVFDMSDERISGDNTAQAYPPQDVSPDNSGSNTELRLSENYYSVIQDGGDDVRSGAFQVSTSVYSKALAWQNTYTNVKDSEEQVSPTSSTNQRGVSDKSSKLDGPATWENQNSKISVTINGQETNLNSIQGKPESTYSLSRPEEESQYHTIEDNFFDATLPKSNGKERGRMTDGFSLDGPRAIKGNASDTYENTHEYLALIADPQEHSPNSAFCSPKELSKIPSNQASESGSFYHIFEAETASSDTQKPDSGNLYHILEPDSDSNVENSDLGVTTGREMAPKRRGGPSSSDALPRKEFQATGNCATEDYNTLAFAQKRCDGASLSVDVIKRDPVSDVKDDIYNGLNECDEDTYSELKKEQEIKGVLDDAYCHINYKA